jgi:hypothetical protein
MYYPPYNDLLFEIYHYISQSNIILLNKASKRMRLIDRRIERYIYHNKLYTHDLFYACATNDLKMINKYIKTYAISNTDPDKWNKPFIKACYGGNMKLVKWTIKKGANKWNSGLCSAGYGGHINIMKLMIKKIRISNNDLLGFACKNDNIMIAKFAIKNGANDWNKGLYYACSYENEELIKLMIRKGATKCVSIFCSKTLKDHL